MTNFCIHQFLRSGALFAPSADRLIVGWGERQWHAAQPPLSEHSFYFPDYFLKESTPWMTHQFHAILTLGELKSLLPRPENNQKKVDWIDPQIGQFQAVFRKLQPLFVAKKLKKAVPYLFASSPYQIQQDQLALVLASALSYAQLHPIHLYGFWDCSDCPSGLLGATPEVLFKYTGAEKRLSTMACAGTMPLSMNAIEMLNDSKMLHEHRCVVDGIVDALSGFGTAEVGEMELRHFGALAHLVTPIELNHCHASFNSLLKALHPTAAVGALPKQLGWEWLLDYQTKVPRQRYGAPVGYIHQNDAHCLVGIRNLQWNKDGVQLGVGCGVVPESQCELEWEELNLKLRTIKGIFGI